MGMNGRRLNVTHKTDTKGRVNSSLVGASLVLVLVLALVLEDTDTDAPLLFCPPVLVFFLDIRTICIIIHIDHSFIPLFMYSIPNHNHCQTNRQIDPTRKVVASASVAVYEVAKHSYTGLMVAMVAMVAMVVLRSSLWPWYLPRVVQPWYLPSVVV